MKNSIPQLTLSAFLIILSVFIVSCSGTKNSSGADYVVSIVPEEGTFELGTVFSEYRIIPLTGCVISNINKIIFTDDCLIVFGEVYESLENTDAKNLVSLFSKDGEYLGPLVRFGRGPDEQTNVNVVCLNRFTGTIDILADGDRIVRYDPATRRSVMSAELDKERILSAEGIIPIDGESYLIFKGMMRSNSDEYKLNVFNAVTGEAGAQFLDLENRMFFGQCGNLFEYEDEVYFYDGYETSVYKYHDDRLTPFITFAENKYSLPKSMNPLSSQILNLDLLFNGPYVCCNFNLCRRGMFLLSNYFYNGGHYLCVIDLNDSSCQSYTAIHDNLVFGLTTEDVATFNMAGFDDSHVYYYVEPEVVRDLVEGLPEQNENCMMISSLPESANPVIIALK